VSSALSVVIPVFNGARFLGETIRSLLAQTRTDFRLVCIDDASDDDSAGIAKAAGGDRIEVLRNPARLGLAANWNRAIEIADADAFVIAHQDDVYEPRYLETLASVLDARPRAFAVHCKATTIDERGTPIDHPAGLFKERFWSDEDPMERPPERELAMLQRGNYVIAPSVMFRSASVARLGRFDARYEFVTDWEYWIRGVLAGETLVGIHERLVKFRRHAQTATRMHERTLRRYEEEIDLLQRVAERHPAKRAFQAVERTLLADFVDRLASGDREGARTLADFGRERVPGFRGALFDRVMRAALLGGAPAGGALRLARRLYLGRAKTS